jgi:glucosyl-dolichyl phosphate glucuronosyltransferase
MDITAVIATYNNAESLEETLKSLLAQEDEENIRYEILVVDNNSLDRTRDIVHEYIPLFKGRLRTVLESRKGTAYARNQGIREAAAPIVAFTDDDCRVDPRWMRSIHDAFKDPRVEVLQGRILLGTAIPREIWYPAAFIRSRMACVDYGDTPKMLNGQDFVTANAAFRKEVFDRFGAFSPHPAFKTNEDTELSVRLRRAGVRGMYVPGMTVYHHFSAARLQERRLLRQSYYWGRSAIFSDQYDMPGWRYFLCCFKQMAGHFPVYIAAFLRKDKEGAFYAKCKIYTAWGRCVQLCRQGFRKGQ